MKSELLKSAVLRLNRKRYLITLVLGLFIVFTSGKTGERRRYYIPDRQDTGSQAISGQVKKLKGDLHFPGTVERFYKLKGNQLVWIFPDTVKAHSWEAMLMLDCILQFGLNHNDYHPDKLISIRMHRLITNYSQVSIEEKAAFDVMLTDAVITFMNHLHYGKLNPVYAAKRIDEGISGGFRADTSLANAFKKADFMSAVLSAQPKSRAYSILQSSMRLITGQYVGDCYEVPPGEVRKIAVNMERLRWTDMTGEKFLQVNIPSNTLRFQLPDTAYQFKVVVGNPLHPTPVLQSSLSGFIITNQSYEGNKLSPQIIFPFKNAQHIDISGISEKSLLHSGRPAYRQGSIQVQQPQKLAKLLLMNDGQKEKIRLLMNEGRQKQDRDFKLRSSLPVKITYLTCEVIDGEVIMYNDPYRLDQNLEKALFGNAVQ